MLQGKLLAMAAMVAVVLAAGGAGADTRTWYVEKDGSGDFTVIQDAVDAASSGDTIRIGAGRWDDYRWEQGWVVYTWVIGKDLTFIGEGSTVTIIGHENPSFPHPTDGVAFSLSQSCAVTRFEDIGFDMPGLRSRAVSNLGARVEVQNCRFSNLLRGVYTEGIDGGFVRHSEFENVNFDNSGNGVALYTPARNFVIEHCTFVDCRIAVRADWSGAQDIVVQHCTITGGESGVYVASGASATIRGCVISGQSILGIGGHGFGVLVVEGNHVSIIGQQFPARAFSILGSGGELVLRDNVFVSDSIAMSIATPIFTPLTCRGNHFLQHNGQGWLAYAWTTYSGDPVHLDVTENWWGTDDVDYIAEHIWDGNDDPNIQIFFDYVPIAGGPVPVQQQTWTEVKGLFRD
jgi:hypothetical protein